MNENQNQHSKDDFLIITIHIKIIICISKSNNADNKVPKFSVWKQRLLPLEGSGPRVVVCTVFAG